MASAGTKKSAASKSAAKKAPVKKAAAKKPARKAAAKKPIAKKAPAKRAAATKSATKKSTAKKAPPKKAATKSATKKAPAKKSATKKAPAKKSATKKAPAKKAAFDKRFLDSQRALLASERARLLKDADSLDAEANELAQLREPGDVQFDEESGEGDTLAVERERDLALSAQFRLQIEEIDRADAKIDEGVYGICEISGQPIPRERLKAIPWARERVEYKVGGVPRR